MRCIRDERRHNADLGLQRVQATMQITDHNADGVTERTGVVTLCDKMTNRRENMISSHEYALKLETAFRRNNHCIVTADEFQHDFGEALENGLLRLVAENLITASELNAWMEEYDFSSKSLNSIIADVADKERIEELIHRIRYLIKERDGNNE